MPELLNLAIAILIALTIHEFAHAIVAYWLGDPTAKNAGRITLNPIKHLDPWGTLLFIITQAFGWGKPVPVNPNYFKKPKRDSALVALAGPASNIILAILLTIPLNFDIPLALATLIQYTFYLNIVLAVFNLIPIPPLDGSKIIAIVLPKNTYYKYNNFINANLAYIIIFLFADIYLFPTLFNFSLIGTTVNFFAGHLETIIKLGS
jgi:Zn-dependent protease